MGKGIRTIEITFPDEVDPPDGFFRTLDALVDMACKAWEEENPGFVMWPAGHGSKPVWSEPQEPTFDDSYYVIDVSSRAATDREIERGRVKAAPDPTPSEVSG